MNRIVQILGITSILAAFTVAQDNDLTITPTGGEHLRAEGKSIFYTCSVVGADPEQESNLRWFNPDGTEIQDNSGRVYIETRSRSEVRVYVTNIKDTDGGMYECRGRIEGNEISVTTKLYIFKDIKFEHAPINQHPALDTDALIECRVTGHPTPTVTWRYRGLSIQPFDSERYTYEPNGLVIKQITEDDNGQYTCRAEVQEDGRLEERVINVIVHIKPTTKVPMESITEGIEDHEVTLECKADGKPAPQYEFYRLVGGGSLVKVGNDGERRKVDQMGGGLHFRPVKKDDEGVYICRAFNDVGQIDSQGKLEVIVPPRLSEMKNQTALEGQSSTLSCFVNAFPEAQMKFRKPELDFDFTVGKHEGGRIQVVSPAPNQLDLTISNLKPEDSSNYTCIAENSGGHMHVNGTIIVEYRPRFPPNQPREFFAWAGKITNITCYSEGEPTPAVSWWREDYRYLGGELKRVENNETFKIFDLKQNSALQVKVRQEDEGWIYGPVTCRAANARGTNDIELKLTQARIPDRPELVTLKDDDPTMIILTVTPPIYTGGMPIIGYRVEYESRIQDFQLGEEIRIENLKPSTNYIFRIRAKSEVGVGNYYEFTHTTQDIQEPRSVEIASDPKGKDPLMYVVQWEKPRTGGLPITRYMFRYRQVEVYEGTWDIKKPLTDFEKHLVQDDADAPMTFYTMNGLKPDTFYGLEIRAENDIGWSLPTFEFVFRTAPDLNPTPVVVVTSKVDSEQGDGAEASRHQVALGTGAILGIIIAVFFIFLIIVDISCYVMNDCGVINSICVRACNKPPGGAKDLRNCEEGESKKTAEKRPLAEDHSDEIIEAKEAEAVASQQINEGDKMDGDEPETGSEEENKDGLIQDSQQEAPPVMEEYEPDEKSPLNQETQGGDAPEIIDTSINATTEAKEDLPEPPPNPNEQVA